jgi:hypothetical protein
MHRFVEFIDTVSEKLIALEASFHFPGRSGPMRGPAGYLAIIWDDARVLVICVLMSASVTVSFTSPSAE